MKRVLSSYDVGVICSVCEEFDTILSNDIYERSEELKQCEDEQKRHLLNSLKELFDDNHKALLKLYALHNYMHKEKDFTTIEECEKEEDETYLYVE